MVHKPRRPQPLEQLNRASRPERDEQPGNIAAQPLVPQTSRLEPQPSRASRTGDIQAVELTSRSQSEQESNQVGESLRVRLGLSLTDRARSEPQPRHRPVDRVPLIRLIREPPIVDARLQPSHDPFKSPLLQPLQSRVPLIEP